MKTVFFDIDTQFDFVLPAGALYVPGAERTLPVIERLNRRATELSAPVISTTDAHAEADPEFADWPPHCVAGTWGQHKPAGTLLGRRVVVPSVAGEFAAGDADQIILEKQVLDCFSNPNLPALLDELGAERCVVYGVATEFCVRCASMGLLATGRRVEIVSDAIRGIRPEDEGNTLGEFESAGGHLISAADL